DELAKTVLDYQAKCTRLQTELETQAGNDSSRNQEFEEQIQSLKSAQESSTTHIRSLEERNKVLNDHLGGDWVRKSRYNDAQKALKEAEAKITELQEQVVAVSKASSTSSDNSQISEQLQSALNEIAVLKQSNDHKTAQINALLTVPGSSTSAGSSSELQNEIDSLRASLATTKQSLDQEKKTLLDANEVLKQKISRLAKNDQRKAWVGFQVARVSSSSESDMEAIQIIATRRSTRRVLSRADVDGALREARRVYGLGGTIQDKIVAAESESNESQSSVRPQYMIGGRTKRQSPFIIKTKENHEKGTTGDKGKQKQSVNFSKSDSSGGEDLYSENDKESNSGRTREAYARKGTRLSWTKTQQTNQSNKLVRAQFHEMLNIRQSNEAPSRPGIEINDKSRLEKFVEDPDKHECADIAKNSRDPKRFAQMDWSLLARDRVYRALLSISKARPRPGETKKEALNRMMNDYLATLANSKNVFSRHRKLDLRKRVATTMIQVCKERGKAGDDAARTEGVAFWQWVLNLLEHAGPELMSDEEDLHVLDETIPERPISVAAKEVLSLAWRHPYFTKLFIFIDVTTGLEAMVFQRTGHPSM
ncbi:hypothetical protein GGU10DRAFT_337797, partial [Lentinula aff. detonsa]